MKPKKMLRVLALVLLVALTTANSYTCPGASPANSEPGTENCAAPTCTTEIWVKNRLMPHENPQKFYQCGPGLTYFVMSCPANTCFSNTYQVCVHALQWKNPCMGTTTTTAPPTTTTSEPEEITTIEPEEVTTIDSVEVTPTEPEVPVVPTEPTTKKPFTGQLCPGVQRDEVESGDYECVAPVCGATSKGLKYPDADPQYYYECIVAGAHRRVRCPTGRCYSMATKECVLPEAWVNSCIG